MELRKIIRENWLTRPPRPRALDLTLLLAALLCLASFSYLTGYGHGPAWMPASRELVFERGEWWRAWTTIFAHADLGHLLSNLLLFIPFSYFLLGYFSRLFFPLAAFALGGVANLLVLATMPPKTTLVGVSGVVYWMGAAWLTLYLLIDKRDFRWRRWSKVIFTAIVLFVPETYRPEVSYLCHLIGFAFGAASGALLYLLQRETFRKAVRHEIYVIPPESWEQEALEADGAPGQVPSFHRERASDKNDPT